MYASNGTRPNIAFAVHHFTQFTSRPSHTHWMAVKYVMRYIKRTPILGITLSGSDFTLKGYCDADRGNNLSNHHSISAYLFKLRDETISWCSKKQKTFTQSTMKAKYYALGNATCEVLWLNSLLSKLGYAKDKYTTLITNNQSAISFAYSSQFHTCAKYIDICHHFIRILIEDSHIEVIHCASEDNCANMLTKALPQPAHIKQLKLANMSAC